jgi:hypothetical protein
MTKGIIYFNNGKAGFETTKFKSYVVVKLSISKLNPINPLVLLCLNRHCSQNEEQRKEKGFQEEVHVSADRWSIRAIDELRGALRRQAKPSCKEIC